MAPFLSTESLCVSLRSLYLIRLIVGTIKRVAKYFVPGQASRNRSRMYTMPT